MDATLVCLIRVMNEVCHSECFMLSLVLLRVKSDLPEHMKNLIPSVWATTYRPVHGYRHIVEILICKTSRRPME